MIPQLTDDTFEKLLSRLNEAGQVLHKESSQIIDLKQAAFIDPYGMVGLLELGEYFKSKGIQKTIRLPESEEVIRYLERMDFFKFVEKYYEIESKDLSVSDKYLRSSSSDVLLEITPVEKSDDIHFIVGRVKERAHLILERHLHYDDRVINGFIVALSEVCQNIIEHSENTGFVGIQKYRFNNINKNVVKIAVMDLGIGFKNSLKARLNIEEDIDAIEKAFIHGASRYKDAGRGHGLAAVRRFVNQWNGKISIRSGTAKFSIIPDWGWGKEREHNLVRFPGAQINILLPEIGFLAYFKKDSKRFQDRSW